MIGDNVNATDSVDASTDIIVNLLGENNNVNVTDAHILNTTKVLNDNANVTDSVNAVLMQGLNQTISSDTNNVNVTDSFILNTTKSILDNVNTTDTLLFNVTHVEDDDAIITDSVVLSADYNQTVGTGDNNVNVTDSLVVGLGQNVTVPSGTNTAIISDSVLLNFTKELFGDQVDMSIANLTIVNGTLPPDEGDPPGGGPPTDAPSQPAGGGGFVTSKVDPTSASLTGLALFTGPTLSKQ